MTVTLVQEGSTDELRVAVAENESDERDRLIPEKSDERPLQLFGDEKYDGHKLDEIGDSATISGLSRGDTILIIGELASGRQGVIQIYNV